MQVGGKNIYDPVQKKVLRDFPIFKGSDFLSPVNNQAGSRGQANRNRESLKLYLESPTRIKFDGRFQKNITFDMIVRNLLRRLQLLSTFYCDGPDFVDFTPLIEKSKQVKVIDKKINWQQQMRFSYRQEKNVSMGGVSGWIEFAGNVADFIPYLKIGEFLHIGKGTGLGLGKIKIEKTHNSYFSIDVIKY